MSMITLAEARTQRTRIFTITNAVELDRVKAYVSSIFDEDYLTECGGLEGRTDKLKAVAFMRCFENEYGHEIPRYGLGRPLLALASYLQGLPSAGTVAFYNGEIIELGKAWGAIKADATEDQEDQWLDDYWVFMASIISTMSN